MGDDAKPEIGKDLVTLDQASRHLAESGLERQEWSGLPVTIPGLSLVLEPRYKHKCLEDFRWKECYDEHGVRHAISEPPPPEESGLEIVNSWWNSRCQLTIFVVKDKQGRAQLRVGCEDRLTFTIRTLDAAAVWPVEAERKAQERLGGLIPADAFEF